MKLVLSFDIGIKNMALCLMDTDSKKILKWKLIDISSEKKNDLNDMSKNLINAMDDLVLEDLDVCDSFDVLIENQPVMKAPTMKSIQMILYTYFQVMSIHDGRDIKITLVSAMKKNSFMKAKGYDVKSKNYKSNKDNSMKYVEEYLSSNNDRVNLELLKSYKKKDDMCDALIQILCIL
jgi:hypothetical protein